jgi:hypothetical protein
MNRATSEVAKEAAAEEGLQPVMSWVKDTIDAVILNCWGYDDIEFKWDMEESVDPAVQATIDCEYVKTAIVSVDEVRDRLGLEPIGLGNAVFTGGGATLVADILNPPEPPPMPGFPPKGKGDTKGAPPFPPKKANGQDASAVAQ